MPIHGKNIIGFSQTAQDSCVMESIDPSNSTPLNKFHIASDSEINMAVSKASEAFETYRYYSGEKKASFLEAIAEEILALGDELIDTAVKESGLPAARITGERGRTINQLKLFAELLREGSWVEAIIDTTQPDREPLPKPDIRKMSVPIGPVVVFTASNFPLAFSTAGGDTASALAAGNPVIVKAHGSHLGTNELVAGAISKAAKKTMMPDGIFSSLNGSGNKLGQQLVKHPEVKAVGFTGSYNGGMAIFKAASEREEPIPVFAEMGSINPVILLPGKLKEADDLAKQYAASITLGVGQFCTNPGLILGIESPLLDSFMFALAKEIEKAVPAPMLNEGIHSSFIKSREILLNQNGVQLLGAAKQTDGVNLGNATVASVSGEEFLSNPHLTEEVFGPFSLVVTCKDQDELKKVILSTKGQLTSTIMAESEELSQYKEIVNAAQHVAGRVIFNGVPTGVEVCHAMHHGGPFPSSSNSKYTSVGTDAIKRFVRPLSFQSFPDNALPDELKNNNPLGIWRKVNGNLTQNSI
ncbi:aldehyde dehydrogenase (NADP(+)) [Marinigracilibium pacificum]|uniref:Aldehyde dehydrogenase (NADP(+)) n=1 Tax=Marinigracilibium pacificum TaxID=2729599 RepID=A0A848J539_9BACT|nr:aldehyde dehydrogenase (NADP(+)) [Marinigracilibium pacificum]NMM50378.1 aldehyde dehydrogenase (NADP(+)) [Marinigracilibium pacificum]